MSDILIRGMEMPKDCPFCPMAHWNKFDALTGCNVVPGKKFVPETESEYWYSDHRPSWCPLVPLPANHGRLIDADVLSALVEEPIEVFTSRLGLRCPPTIVPAEGGKK